MAHVCAHLPRHAFCCRGWPNPRKFLVLHHLWCLFEPSSSPPLKVLLSMWMISAGIHEIRLTRSRMTPTDCPTAGERPDAIVRCGTNFPLPGLRWNGLLQRLPSDAGRFSLPSWSPSERSVNFARPDEEGSHNRTQPTSVVDDEMARGSHIWAVTLGPTAAEF